MILLNGMIRSGRLKEFCNEFIQIHNKDEEERTMWEYYLHRVFDQSFSDFKESVTVEAAPDTSKEQIHETITASRDLLNNFSLDSQN